MVYSWRDNDHAIAGILITEGRCRVCDGVTLEILSDINLLMGSKILGTSVICFHLDVTFWRGKIYRRLIRRPCRPVAFRSNIRPVFVQASRFSVYFSRF